MGIMRQSACLDVNTRMIYSNGFPLNCRDDGGPDLRPIATPDVKLLPVACLLLGPPRLNLRFLVP